MAMEAPEISDHEKAKCQSDCMECGEDRSKHYAQFLVHEPLTRTMNLPKLPVTSNRS